MKGKLPLLISVPHGGLEVPAEALEICMLNRDQVAADSDAGADQIFTIEPMVQGYVAAKIARCIVDTNREPMDLSRDGVVKTHTLDGEPVYGGPLDQVVVAVLLKRYYYPYHKKLTELAGSGALAGVDCHTMAENEPQTGRHAGAKRPWVCVSNSGCTCNYQMMASLARCLEGEFTGKVSINHPMPGGYIIEKHAGEIPWVRVDISRENFASNFEKRKRFLSALKDWVKAISGQEIK